VSEGTVAAGAAVDLVVVPAAVGCADCGHQAEATDVLATCAACGGTDLEVAGGDELVLESIQLRNGKR
jgi:hydrogenase nickel incorporation protein HypA/HybF